MGLSVEVERYLSLLANQRLVVPLVANCAAWKVAGAPLLQSASPLNPSALRAGPDVHVNPLLMFLSLHKTRTIAHNVA